MFFNCLEDVESIILVSFLYLVVYNGYCEVLKILVEMLVNLDVRDYKGWIVFFLVMECGFIECVEVFMVYGVFVFIKECKCKWMFLYVVVVFGYIDFLYLLIDSGE